MSCLVDMLKSVNPPDALYCYNDTEASMAYEAVQSLDLKVSDDVGIVGTDNTIAAAAMSPPLTSLDLHAERIGLRAMEMIMSYSDLQHPPQNTFRLVDSDLVVRRSCLGPCK